MKQGKELISDPYICLNLIWCAVVLGVYSISNAVQNWYIYSSYIALGLLGTEALAYILKKMPGPKAGMKIVLPTAFIITAMAISLGMIRYYPWKGHGGMPAMNLHDSLLGVKERAEQEYSKKTAYFETTYNVQFEPWRWEHDYMFYAVTILDLICRDGGVKAFLETDDREAVLILDKNLWETYAPVLTGHVILEDSTYVMFSKRRYGE